MEWVVLGGICVALVAVGFAKHVYYVVKHVWAIRHAFKQPTGTLPENGVTTIKGIVSGIGEQTPVTITLHEHGNAGRGQIYWHQALRDVKAHPFALLVPEIGARILVEPGADVQLRAAAQATEWDNQTFPDKLVRYRTATLEDGDRAMITGSLSEKRHVERIASEYRTTKETIKVEYILRPVAGAPLRIDSQTMLEEIRTSFGWLGWAKGLGILVLAPAYAYAVSEAFSTKSAALFVVLLVVYALKRLSLLDKDRRPWFDRANDPKKPYRGAENRKTPKDLPF